MPEGRKILWTEEMDALLGTMVDWKVAQDLGIGVAAVYLRRVMLGRPSWKEQNELRWTSEMDILLGTMIDRQVAGILGIRKAAVKWRREKLGIPAYGPTRVEWTLRMDALLGTMPNTDLAGRLGISVSSVRRRRRELGIPSCRERVIPKGMSRWDPEAGRIYTARRTHKKLGLPDTLTYEQWRFACEYFNNRCAYCGKKAYLAEDHLVPLSKDGPRSVSNIIPACTSCNSSKGNRKAHVWIYQKFGTCQGKKIVVRIEAYLREAIHHGLVQS